MGANFLFDGSAESKEQLKLFLLYSDEGFKVSPPVYLRRFFDASSGAEIGNLRDLREYERQLDRAIAFVRENTLGALPPGGEETFRRCAGEIAGYLRQSEARPCPALETGEDGLTYEDLIHPDFFDIFASELSPALLETFKYRASLRSAFSIMAVTEPADDIAVTSACREILAAPRLVPPAAQREALTSAPGAGRAEAVLLPRWDSLSLSDTMEVKLRAHDELEELRFCVRRAVSAQGSGSGTLEDAVRADIEPAVRALEGRLRSMRFGVAQKLLEELKAPTSCTPLVLGLVTDLPQGAAAAASLALIAAGTALDYLRRRSELKSEPMYYLHRLRRLTRRSGG
ncbi:MAG TPA: hypothetical protein IAB77_05025 [Candidatus Scatomorpha intestinavium]|uniref:Uncharacterized protein n=1 Tax=Candidatus Scatomorpha intestinavium TaxID=2840922 RepID=A0A9D0ZDI8_9FIRM|nr:hypothetical protein [Candidatus Scatomorpha intestinavium]